MMVQPGLCEKHTRTWLNCLEKADIFEGRRTRQCEKQADLAAKTRKCAENVRRNESSCQRLVNSKNQISDIK